MKIAVICANGKAGRKIAQEAAARGHDVTAFARGENKSGARHFVNKDIFSLTKQDIAGFDAVIDCFGAWTEESLPQHGTSLMHLAELVKDTDIRLYVVGGAGSLYTDKEHTQKVMDLPDFPDMFKALAKAMSDALNKLRACENVNWTYVSPACDFRAEGEKTGNYAFAGEELAVNAKGESFISYADYASAMLDLAEQKNHSRERVSVYSR